jgi:uncharacterized damage-inducible protein DinB
VNQPNESDQLASRLERVVGSVVENVKDLSSEALHREPAPGEWSVMMTLGHVSEVLPYWSRQARRIALSDRDDEPIGRALDDPDRVGAVERHANSRIEDILSLLHDGLAEATRTLRDLPTDRWSRTAQHPRLGAITVEYIVEHFLVEHVEEHLGQIETTLATIR